MKKLLEIGLMIAVGVGLGILGWTVVNLQDQQRRESAVHMLEWERKRLGDLSWKSLNQKEDMTPEDREELEHLLKKHNATMRYFIENQ